MTVGNRSRFMAKSFCGTVTIPARRHWQRDAQHGSGKNPSQGALLVSGPLRNPIEGAESVSTSGPGVCWAINPIHDQRAGFLQGIVWQLRPVLGLHP